MLGSTWGVYSIKMFYMFIVESVRFLVSTGCDEFTWHATSDTINIHFTLE